MAVAVADKLLRTIVDVGKLRKIAPLRLSVFVHVISFVRRQLSWGAVKSKVPFDATMTCREKIAPPIGVRSRTTTNHHHPLRVQKLQSIQLPRTFDSKRLSTTTLVSFLSSSLRLFDDYIHPETLHLKTLSTLSGLALNSSPKRRRTPTFTEQKLRQNLANLPNSPSPNNIARVYKLSPYRPLRSPTFPNTHWQQLPLRQWRCLLRKAHLKPAEAKALEDVAVAVAEAAVVAENEDEVAAAQIQLRIEPRLLNQLIQLLKMLPPPLLELTS